MKLTSNRRKDQVHLLDMIEIGTLEESWLARVRVLLRALLLLVFFPIILMGSLSGVTTEKK